VGVPPGLSHADATRGTPTLGVELLVQSGQLASLAALRGVTPSLSHANATIVLRRACTERPACRPRPPVGGLGGQGLNREIENGSKYRVGGV